jgi:transposase
MVYLESDSPRVQCKEHGVVAANVPWARHRSRFTYDFEQMVAWLSSNCSKKAVSELLRISWNTVGPIISRIRIALDPNPTKRFDNLRRIGIDETSYRKGHKYMTVVVDHDTGKVVWVAKGHGKTVLTEFFKLLTKEQRGKIEHVTADGARWIAQCVEEYCPNAIRCIDPFHVVQWAMEAVDSVRREAWQDDRVKMLRQGIQLYPISRGQGML